MGAGHRPRPLRHRRAGLAGAIYRRRLPFRVPARVGRRLDAGRLYSPGTAAADRRRRARGMRPPGRRGAGRRRARDPGAAPAAAEARPILDRYISRIYLRVAGLSFLALLGLSTSGRSSTSPTRCSRGRRRRGWCGSALVYMTPQFVYFVIPLAALLSVLVTFGLLRRSSELSVMKACGISLYRIALPLCCCRSPGAAIFALEQGPRPGQRQAEALDARSATAAPRPSTR